MKIIEYDTIPKPESMTLEVDPLHVYLSKTTELRIERGDKIIDVADAVKRHWSMFDMETIMRIVGCWFSIGERVAGGKNKDSTWTEREARAHSTRRYLEGITAEQVARYRKSLGLPTPRRSSRRSVAG